MGRSVWYLPEEFTTKCDLDRKEADTSTEKIRRGAGVSLKRGKKL